MRAPLTSATTLLLLAFAFLMPGCCFAQAPFKPTQLPAPTSFYLIWRGTPERRDSPNQRAAQFLGRPGLRAENAGSGCSRVEGKVSCLRPQGQPLRTLLAQPTGNIHSATPKNFLAARSQFSAKLTGFSYFDFP
jgi:hypothetical protein